MADNIPLPNTAFKAAADEIGEAHFQRVKLTLGADGVNDGDVSSANPMPVQVTNPTATGLTDTQLRATPVPISGTVSVSNMVAQGLTDTQLRATPVPISGTVSVSNMVAQGLTDTQLRATPVPVSGSVELGATSLAALESINVLVTNSATEITNDSGNPIPVSGTVTADTGLSQPLTDTQLRATPVPVSGTVTANTGLSQPLTDTQLRAVAVPVSGTVTADTGLTQPLTDTQLRATAVPVSLASVPSHAVTNSGTFAVQVTSAPTTAVTGTFWQATQPVSGTVSVSNMVAQGLTDAQLRAAAVPVSGSVSVSNMVAQGLTDTQLRATPVPVSGTFWQATQPVSAASLPLPTGAATETTLAALNTKMPAQGQALMAASHPVVIASNQSNVPFIPPAALLSSYNVAGVIAINTILLTLDCNQYRSASVQCVSMGTTGVVTPEWSNDNATWVAATIFTQAGASATTISASGLWVTPVFARYLRLRLSTATTAGTTTFSVHQFDAPTQEWLATQPVSGTVTANIGTGSIAAGTNLAMDVGVQVRATTNGTTVTNILSAATNNLTQLKGTAGKIAGGFLSNTTASLQYLKLFNVPSASVTMGTTSATTQIALQPNQTINLSQGDFGTFLGGTGVTIAITTGSALADNTATTAGSVVGFIAWV